jgi:hypothetical protein
MWATNLPYVYLHHHNVCRSVLLQGVLDLSRFQLDSESECEELEKEQDPVAHEEDPAAHWEHPAAHEEDQSVHEEDQEEPHGHRDDGSGEAENKEGVTTSEESSPLRLDKKRFDKILFFKKKQQQGNPRTAG